MKGRSGGSSGPGIDDLDITTSEWKLTVENDQLILRSGQFSDADRITPKDVRRSFGRIIAGTEDDDFAPGNCFNKRSKSLSVETRTKSCAAAYSRILRSPIRASPFRSALSDSGNKSCNSGTRRGDKLSSKRSFILWR